MAPVPRCGLLVAAVMVLVVAVASAQLPMPPAWADQFIMGQTQYLPENGQAKQQTIWYYDYTTGPRHRLDHHTIRNTRFNLLPTNSSEWWIGNDLYMYDWDKDSCTHLDMGFGIPRPNWFVTGSSIVGPEWLYRDDLFYQTVQVSKPAPYSPFNYYALVSDGTPFRIVAPGPTGSIFCNDLKNYTATAPKPSVFNLPASPVCITGSMKTLEHHHWFSLRLAQMFRNEQPRIN